VTKASDITDRTILEAVYAFRMGTADMPERALADRFPWKVVNAKMEKAYKRGWVECGVSLRTAWLTDAGTEALMLLRNEKPEQIGVNEGTP
jgi:hypothetical protein